MTEAELKQLLWLLSVIRSEANDMYYVEYDIETEADVFTAAIAEVTKRLVA